MIDSAEPTVVPARTRRRRPRWLRRLSVASERGRLIPVLEIAVLLVLVGMIAASYFVVPAQTEPDTLLAPWVAAGLLVANLIPAMALMVLIARRIARRRAAKGELKGRGRLHVRLVAF